ncbi:MAG: 1-acyl-sn-glycerol-3-phosphate acyltransferase [Cellvibrionaceae bacterium]|nr:1-acyl-sn-glycerol-3-phosphate acyltransferase [Cellvibrionaceae bacterium]
MSEFDDIRPYNDDEVRPILNRLLNDPEFLDSIAQLKFPNAGMLLARFVRPLVRKRLRREVEGVESVEDFQARIESYLKDLLDRTVTKLSVSGLDNLSANKAYLFISNHRDIAMDSALVNWALFHNQFGTLRIAIGDNLLTKPFASDLMRLNKSFIVNRSATAPREKFKAAKRLSKYIQQSVLEDGEHVWIAQKEGRAKDGIDKTNSAIINMLCMSKRKTRSLGEYIAEANIVPVSISYEYDPCDQLKARELFEKASSGSYHKGEHEDVMSIAEGIKGFKGNVCLNFGEPLGEGFASIDEVTDYLDKKIISGYLLHPSNCFAYQKLYGKTPAVKMGEDNSWFGEGDWESQRAFFNARIAGCPKDYLEHLLHAYANPVVNKLELNN